MRNFTHPDASSLDLASVLDALGDPTRLAIVAKLSKCESMSCGDVCAATPRSTLTHHLRILREAGVIHTTKSGQTHFNALRTEDLNQRFPNLLTTILTNAS